MSLQRQASRSIEVVTTALDRLINSRHVPAFTLSFGTTVFTSQLTKLRDVHDPLIHDIIELYSFISGLQDSGRLLNEFSAEARALRPVFEVPGPGPVRVEDERFQLALANVGSACRVLLEQLRPFHTRTTELLSKLPE
jgi:hypothetical protein